MNRPRPVRAIVAFAATEFATTVKAVRRAPRTAASAATDAAVLMKVSTPVPRTAALRRANAVTAFALPTRPIKLVRPIAPIRRPIAVMAIADRANMPCPAHRIARIVGTDIAQARRPSSVA